MKFEILGRIFISRRVISKNPIPQMAISLMACTQLTVKIKFYRKTGLNPLSAHADLCVNTRGALSAPRRRFRISSRRKDHFSAK